ncbi:hypothetical protein D3C86_2061820 [compost metagenome]
MLAVERDKPKTKPAETDQPRILARPRPSRVAILIWTMAPGMAMPFTAIRSFSEK